MAIANLTGQLASQFNGGGVTTVVKAYPGDNTTGNLLVACLNSQTSTSSITYSLNDTAGNTWSRAATFHNTLIPGHAEIWYAMNAIGSANTVTATASSEVSNLAITLQEYSGAATASALDGVATGATRDANPSITIDPGNLTTTVSGDLIVSFVLWDSQYTYSLTPPPMTAGSGFTERVDFNPVAGLTHSAQDKVAGGAGSEATAWANDGNVWVAVAASFKAAGGVTRKWILKKTP